MLSERKHGAGAYARRDALQRDHEARMQVIRDTSWSAPIKQVARGNELDRYRRELAALDKECMETTLPDWIRRG